MSNSSTQIPRWVADWALIVGLVVLVVTFVNYGMSLLYPAPEYDDFCNQQRHASIYPAEQFDTQKTCTQAGGKWTSFEDERPAPRQLSVATSATTTTVSGTCDRDFYCRESYEDARDLHHRNGLIILLIIGAGLAAFGFRREKSDIVSSAAAISGVIVILSGLSRYWSGTEDWAQFVLLGSLLLVFIYLALKRR